MSASKIKLETKQLAKASKKELKRLKELTLQPTEHNANTHYSDMWLSLKHPKDKWKYVVIARDKEEKIIGWALLCKFVLGLIDKGKKQLPVYSVDLGVYVDPKHRRQGIGKKLVSKAKKLKRELWPGIRMYASPWNKGSTKFYKACKMKID